MSVIKYGCHRGKQQYLCRSCGHQYLAAGHSSLGIEGLYHRYCHGKQTLGELSNQSGKSIRTLQRYFDALVVEAIIPPASSQPVNLIVDATFFSRSDGVFVFRAHQLNLHWRFIKSETVAEVTAGLIELEQQGYRFQSVTLDGRRGIIQLFSSRYPGIPIQLCQFHQAQIIRRYTTNNPKTDCGRALKELTCHLTETNEDIFCSLLQSWYDQYEDFLNERNEQGEFKHRPLRSAGRSLKVNLPYLFTYKKYPALGIPNTTNSCDGSFAHWKQKVKIHRGLRQHRRNKLINFLLNSINSP